MKATIVFALLCLWLPVAAQPTIQQQLEDSVIGWKTMYSFKGKQYKPLVVDGHTFSPYQQSLRDSFITWMQRTWKPIGGFGDIYQKDFTSRHDKFPLPQRIGMDALFYGMQKNGRSGKYEMTPSEDHNDVAVYTNALAGANPTLFFNSPEGFYFTMLKDNYASTFTKADVIAKYKEFGLHSDSRFSKYMVYFLGNGWVTVVLTPGNQLPIVQLTKGEVLQLCEKGILKEVEERKKEARQQSSNNPSYYAGVIKDLDEKLYPLCIKNLNALKNKYANRLDETAELYGWAGPSFADFASTTLPTLFIEDWYQNIPGYPAYRFTKEAIENSKKDKPLWVTVTWQTQKAGTRVKAYEVHRAMLRHFNFDYVYDYFFNPEKVKGIAYTPSNAAEQITQVKQLRKHYEVAENKPLPQGVFFMDDFSANSNGSRPAGWSDSKNGTTATIVSLQNKTGKWVQLGLRNELSPSIALKKPLPESFTLEFDMVTNEFSFRTGGSVKLGLSSYPANAEGVVPANSKGTLLEWQITAGNEADYNNNNYSGESVPAINSTITGYEGNYYAAYTPREFTNKKTSLHATVKVKNGQAVFFINGKQIAASVDFKKDYCKDCVCKGIPAGTAFHKISFTNMTQNWSPDGKSNAVNVYISNVSITKD